MIYLKSHKYTQTIYVPIGYTKKGASYQLVLHSTFNLDDIILDVTDERIYGDYFQFTFRLPEGVQTGEYTYKVLADGKVMAQGMAKVDYAEEDIEQLDKDIEYEQYNG